MKNILIMAAAVATFWTWNAQAEALMPDEVEAELAKPIPLFDEEVVPPSDADFEEFDATISYYVQNLNLTPKQLDEAQRISDAGQAKKEELLRQIEELRREAYNLEAGSLIAFEAILNDDQRAAFRELRAENDGAQANSEAKE